MQTRSDVAETGVTQVAKPFGFRALSALFEPNGEWSLPALRLGRQVCWCFYRYGPAAVGPDMCAAIEAAVRVWGPWGELLSGAYRAGSLRKFMVSGARARSGRGAEAARAQGVKPAKRVLGLELGVGAWRGVPSVDGVGGVRAMEVVLYWFVFNQLAHHPFCAKKFLYPGGAKL